MVSWMNRADPQRRDEGGGRRNFISTHEQINAYTWLIYVLCCLQGAWRGGASREHLDERCVASS